MTYIRRIVRTSRILILVSTIVQMLDLSPGVVFVSTKALKLSIPTAALYMLQRRICDRSSVPPLSFSVFLAILSALVLPGIAIGRRWKNFWYSRKAYARGEVLPPAVRDAWPLNVGFLLKMIDAFKAGCLGKWFIVSDEFTFSSIFS